MYPMVCRRVITQNQKYYRRYPGDVERVQRIVLRLLEYPGGGAPLPDGGILRPRGLQLLGEPLRSSTSLVNFQAQL